jgi:site-specific DNA recombinase
MARSDGAPKRCAIYTRKSSEEGLEQNFNSLHAQRQACEAFIRSQAGEGWRLIKTAYDDGGFSGATMERPALKTLLVHVKEKRIDVVVLNCCVTATNDTPWASKISTILAKSARERVSRSTL